MFFFFYLSPERHWERWCLSHVCQEQAVLIPCPSHMHDGKSQERKGERLSDRMHASHLSGPGHLKQTSTSHHRAHHTKTSTSIIFQHDKSNTNSSDQSWLCCGDVCPLLSCQSRALAPVLLSTGWECTDRLRKRGVKDYMHHCQMAELPDKCDGMRRLCR